MKSLLVVLAGLCISLNANALPIIGNGGFEDLGGQVVGGNWSYFPTLPGWQGGDNIEVHKNGFLANGFGNYYVELNAHPGQNHPFELESAFFATHSGQSYKLYFWAQKRRGDDGSFTVEIVDLFGTVFSQVINSHVTGNFTLFSFNFMGTGNPAKLKFISGQGGGDTVGHFLDNVSIDTASVAEPGMLMLLATGLFGLVIRRQRKV